MTLNVFPAQVLIDGVEHRLCRVRTNNSADERMQVWEAQNGQATLLLDELVAHAPAPMNIWAPMQDRRGTYVMMSGTQVEIAQQGGCGCGSPLRNLPTWRALVPQP